MKSIYSLILLLFYVGTAAAAETRYVTDQLEITLRSGKSTRNEILRMLPSGSAVEVLETDADSGYTRVRANNTEGWVLTRYLMGTPAARAQLASMEQRVAKAEERLKQVQDQFQDVSKNKTEAEQERNRLNDQNMKLNRELAEIRRVSANSIQIHNENQALKKRTADAERQIQFLQQENANLMDRSNRDWFVVGAIVVVTSMLLGIGLTRVRWRKKSNWGDL